VRIGNWLTIEQGQRLRRALERTTLRGTRDYAMVAVLPGYRLRRAELARVTVEDLQRREEHRVFADLTGKGGHVRTVPVPTRVGSAIRAWLTAANVSTGPVFRAINKAGRVASPGFSPEGDLVSSEDRLCDVRSSGRRTSRSWCTCARPCHDAGGEIEQIQLLPGMKAFKQRSGISCKQRLRNAVNDGIGFEPDENTSANPGRLSRSNPVNR
jgi:hypothetical protein